MSTQIRTVKTIKAKRLTHLPEITTIRSLYYRHRLLTEPDQAANEDALASTHRSQMHPALSHVIRTYKLCGKRHMKSLLGLAMRAALGLLPNIRAEGLYKTWSYSVIAVRENRREKKTQLPDFSDCGRYRSEWWEL